MNSAVITGATSFIGSNLVSYLAGKGVECYLIVRPESRNLAVLPQNNPVVHLVWGNAANPNEWINQIPPCDTFFHFSWDGVGAEGRSNKDMQQSNIRMTLDCLKAAAKIGCKRFVFSGSQAEYGIHDGLITEETACNPVIEYGKAKLEVLRQAPEVSKEIGIDYVHLRIFSVYGPGDHSWTLVSKCLDSFMKNEEMVLSPCTQDWNFLFSEDAAEAISCFGDCPLDDNPVYNIAGEETKPLKEYVELMRQQCGGGIPQYGLLENMKEPPHGIYPSIERMQQATGWKMKTDFATGIRKILETRGIRK